MNLRNAEHYQDFTAAEAIARAVNPDPGWPDLPDDEGCRLLIAAVARQAVTDYADALRHLPSPSAVRRADETAAFLRSDYFTRLTGLNGRQILRRIRKEVDRE